MCVFSGMCRAERRRGEERRPLWAALWAKGNPPHTSTATPARTHTHNRNTGTHTQDTHNSQQIGCGLWSQTVCVRVLFRLGNCLCRSEFGPNKTPFNSMLIMSDLSLRAQSWSMTCSLLMCGAGMCVCLFVCVYECVSFVCLCVCYLALSSAR